jgi:hypothetical protein
MNKHSILPVIALSLLLGGCGLKDRMFNKDDEAAIEATAQAPQVDEQGSETKTELTGMLLVLEPEKCPLVEGCGPHFSLLGRELKSQIAIEGDIMPEHRNLILSVIGSPAPLPTEYVGQSGYERISGIMKVKKYRLRSSLPYHGFLVEQATEYTTRTFGCDLLWDKSFSWTIEDDVAHLIVRMTDTFSADPQPWVQLAYNGSTGDLIDATVQPEGVQPCQ